MCSMRVVHVCVCVDLEVDARKSIHLDGFVWIGDFVADVWLLCVESQLT